MSWKNDQVSEAETEIILEEARRCLEFEGDFVEFGCYKGDTSLALAEILRLKSVKNANLNAKLWIYDSFEGLPEKCEADFSELGRDFKAGELAVSKREVKERFLRANLPVPVIKKAWFEDLIVADLPEKVSFAFLDGDLYESIKISLKLVENKIEKGTIIVHDYKNEALPGVARAVDEWLEKHNYEVLKRETLIIIRIG